MAKKYLTKNSYQKLLKELEERKFKMRKEISELIRESKDFGDLSENASYKEIREKESFNEARIEQLEEVLRDSEVVSEPHMRNVIEIGDTVELSSGLVFQLVDSQEASPPSKVSIESPLGKAAFGKNIGEEFEVRMPSGNIEKYKVVRILESS
ncbi:MAG: GreA/GreB family elongation factor [Candidatus Portnoybacteria bacterium]|nr:GreA/GreB family elongation factor [Candidatus Portnoybacteria bacterium]